MPLLLMRTVVCSKSVMDVRSFLLSAFPLHDTQIDEFLLEGLVVDTQCEQACLDMSRRDLSVVRSYDDGAWKTWSPFGKSHTSCEVPELRP